MRSISEFIMEQETNTSVSGSDNLIQTYSECVAALSLASCYAEHAAIMEFATENGVDSLSIVMESDDGDTKSESKPGIFKRAGNAAKKAWSKIVEFFKSIHRKISGVIVDKRMGELNKLVQGLSDYKTIEGLTNQYEAFPKFVELFNTTLDAAIDAFEAFHASAGVDSSKLDVVDGQIAKFIDTYKESSDAGKVTGQKLLNYFGSNYEKGKIQSELKKGEKYIHDLEKATKKLGKDESKTNEVNANKGDIEKMKKVVNSITQGYDVALKCFQSTYSSLKKIIKEEKSTQESFYYV